MRDHPLIQIHHHRNSRHILNYNHLYEQSKKINKDDLPISQVILIEFVNIYILKLTTKIEKIFEQRDFFFSN